MLLEYVRDRKNRRVGIVIALNSEQIGWSRANLNAGDRFNKEMGLRIATGRASVHWGESVRVPDDVARVCAKMQDRANRYFKVGQTA